VYDKLGVADRLELALYCLSHHVVDGVKPPPVPAATPEMDNAVGAAAASASSGAAPSSAPAAASSSVLPASAPPEKVS